MKSLDIRDISIIDSLPVYKCRKIVLNVGCGEGRIDYYLAALDYHVYATDITKGTNWHDAPPNLKFSNADIFDLYSFPIHSAPIVICSEVLEHLKDYKTAFVNLLKLTKIRLIITFPYKKSFGGKAAGHCNFWDDENIDEFKELCKPYSIAISRIRTKARDVEMKQYCYLLVIDKRQDKLGGK